MPLRDGLTARDVSRGLRVVFGVALAPKLQAFAQGPALIRCQALTVPLSVVRPASRVLRIVFSVAFLPKLQALAQGLALLRRLALAVPLGVVRPPSCVWRISFVVALLPKRLRAPIFSVPHRVMQSRQHGRTACTRHVVI